MSKVIEPKGTGYHYLHLHQPPGVGRQPDGWTSREGWVPFIKGARACSFGLVVYAEPLTPVELWRFGLCPDPLFPFWPYELDEKIRQVYRRVHVVCERANARGVEYVGFQRLRAGGFRLIATDSNCRGRSSYNLWSPDAPTQAWAVNALYRLQEEGFVPWDWPLDEWFDANFAV